MRRVLTVIAIAATGLLPLPATAQTAPTCFDKTVTIVGTEGSDADGSTTGTEGSDVIHGLGGNDYISGSPHIFGPDLRDWMCGGDGEDRMEGHASHDFMDGGLNADVMHGDAGNDKMFGGPGPDFLWDPHWGADYYDGDQATTRSTTSMT